MYLIIDWENRTIKTVKEFHDANTAIRNISKRELDSMEVYLLNDAVPTMAPVKLKIGFEPRILPGQNT